MQVGELGVLLGTVFGAFGTILYGFYKYAEAREKDFEKQREISDNKARRDSMALAKSLDRVAKATEKAAREAAERNGHLGELILESNKQTEAIAGRAIKEITENISKQTVKEQEVVHQTIKSRDKE
jgi:hypothetical protein